MTSTTDGPAIPSAPPVPLAAPAMPSPGPAAYPAGQPYALPAGYSYVQEDRFTRFFMRLYERAPRWSAPAAVTACVAGAVLYTLAEDRSYVTTAPPCLLRMTTGFDCPGCGGTRAAWFLLNGNLPQAARHHAMFIFAVPFLIYLYVAWSVNTAFGRKLPMLRITPKVIGIFLAVWLVFSVLRNLPFAPFTWLYV